METVVRQRAANPWVPLQRSSGAAAGALACDGTVTGWPAFVGAEHRFDAHPDGAAHDTVSQFLPPCFWPRAPATCRKCLVDRPGVRRCPGIRQCVRLCAAAAELPLRLCDIG